MKPADQRINRGPETYGAGAGRRWLPHLAVLIAALGLAACSCAAPGTERCSRGAYIGGGAGAGV